MSARDRACAAVFSPSGAEILMVEHLDHGNHYWTFPGGGLEPGESHEAAAVREVAEETGLVVEVVRFLFDETYLHDGQPAVSRCFLARLLGGSQAVLGFDPEDAGRPEDEKMLRAVAWKPVSEVSDDVQVRQVLRALS